MLKYVSMFVLFFAVVTEPVCADDVVAPNANLVLTGIPEISREMADTVGRYSDYRSASFTGWLPDDDGMLIATRFGNATQIHRVNAPDARREQLTFFREPVRGATVRPRSNDTFAFVRDSGGDEFYQIFAFDITRGVPMLLSDGEKRNGSPLWSRDGARLAYSRVDANERGAFTEIHVGDGRDPVSDRIVGRFDGGSWTPTDFAPDGSALLITEYISINQSNLWHLDLKTGAMDRLTSGSKNTKVANRGGEFSRDGKYAYFTTDAGSEFRKLARMNLTDRSVEILSGDIDWDVSGFSLSPDGETLALLTNEAGIGVLRLLDTNTGTLSDLRNLPVGTISGVRWHESKPLLGFTVRSAKTPGDAYSIDVQSGDVTRWTYSETGAVDAESFPEPELITWKSFDGLEISGFLYRPPAKFDGKRPVLMNIHGGPEGQARPGYLGSTNYYVQELGMAVILPNVRGSAGFGKTYLQLDNGFKREDSYKDIDALLDWIEEEPTLDEDKVVVRGGSYGGFMTLAVSTYYSDRIACSVDIVGISNLRTFLENTQGYRRDLRRAEYGDERDPEMRAFLDRIAPLTNAHMIRKPMLVIQGKNDPRVPKSESDQIVETLRVNETPVWYLVANDEGHGFKKKANADFAFYTTARFIEEHIK